MWFAATYGDPNTRGGGSNVPAWTIDGRIVYPRRMPESRVAWAYRVGQADLDHFNRDYRPDLARGGACIMRLDPETGQQEPLTPVREGVWDFRATQSPDGRQIAFCRAKTGEAPALWVMDSDGGNERMLTRGIDDLGADHPRWLPLPAAE